MPTVSRYDPVQSSQHSRDNRFVFPVLFCPNTTTFTIQSLYSALTCGCSFIGFNAQYWNKLTNLINIIQIPSSMRPNSNVTPMQKFINYSYQITDPLHYTFKKMGIKSHREPDLDHSLPEKNADRRAGSASYRLGSKNGTLPSYPQIPHLHSRHFRPDPQIQTQNDIMPILHHRYAHQQQPYPQYQSHPDHASYPESSSCQNQKGYSHYPTQLPSPYHKDPLSKIKDHYEQIETIMHFENQNLKEHNQYLLRVIKKMQGKERKHKHQMSEYAKKIQKLENEKAMLKEKFVQLQNCVQEMKVKQRETLSYCASQNKLQVQQPDIYLSAVTKKLESQNISPIQIKVNSRAKIEEYQPQNLGTSARTEKLFTNILANEIEQNETDPMPETLEQLNELFEKEMKNYRNNNDVGARKKCVEIAKKIKNVRAEATQKEINSHSNRRKTLNHESPYRNEQTRTKRMSGYS